jgi:hypothetical protein
MDLTADEPPAQQWKSRDCIDIVEARVNPNEFLRGDPDGISHFQGHKIFLFLHKARWRIRTKIWHFTQAGFYPDEIMKFLKILSE